MKKFAYLFLLSGLIFSSVANAQNCASIAVWNDILEKEFPEVDPNQLRGGTRESNRLLYNLYTDKYFIPFAGKPFEYFTTKEGSSKWKKVGTCRNKKEYANLKFIGWIHNFALEPLWDENRNRLVKKESAYLNNKREEYEASIKEMKINYEDNNKSIKEVERQFAWLMPSEINAYVNIFKTRIVKSANERILKAAGNIAQSANEASVINDIGAFKDVHSESFSQADTVVQNQVNKILEYKAESILEVLIPQEKKAIDELDNSENALAKIELFRKDFEKYYSSYENRNEIRNLKHAIVDKKTNIIIALSKDIQRQISKAPNTLTLIGLSEKYLDHVDYSDPEIGLLNDTIRDRQTQLEKEEYEASKALELKNDAFREFAKKRDEQIKNKRSALQIKYGIKLLELNELHDLLVDNVNLSEDYGKYNVTKANKFFKKMESIGFKRIDEGSLSVVEDYTDQKGNIIRVSNIGKEGKDNHISAEFILKNAPREVVDLYWLELNSGFRKASQAVHGFREEFDKYYNKQVYSPQPFKGDSDYYTDNGIALFDMKLLQNGSLAVSVMSNSNARLPVLAERLSDNELSISSWTSVTDVYLKKGDKISFKASGQIRIAPLWSSTPAGLNGLDDYSFQTQLRHGSLIGKIGDGEWFYIGERSSIIAKDSGVLYLRLNETHVINNDGGQWKVRYDLDKSSER